MAKSKTTKSKQAASSPPDDSKSVAESPAAPPPAPLPATEPAPPDCDRDTIAAAVYAEAMEAGKTQRDALRLAEAVADRLASTLGEYVAHEAGDVVFYDLRSEQDFDYPNDANKVLKRGNQPVLRDIAEIDTIVLHQTACEYGVTKQAIKLAGGDTNLAKARRALDVACHFMAFREGFHVAAHDLRVYVNHAGRFNAKSIGLEIEGIYPGLLDDPDTFPREDLRSTWGGKPSENTEGAILAACDAVRRIVDEVAAAGGKIERVVSHRQSSDARRSDPGQEIWQRVAIECAEEELGLDLFLGSPWNQGRPVPVQWDPRGEGDY